MSSALSTTTEPVYGSIGPGRLPLLAAADRGRALLFGRRSTRRLPPRPAAAAAAPALLADNGRWFAGAAAVPPPPLPPPPRLSGAGANMGFDFFFFSAARWAVAACPAARSAVSCLKMGCSKPCRDDTRLSFPSREAGRDHASPSSSPSRLIGVSFICRVPPPGAG